MKIQDLQVKRQGPFGIEFKGEITVAPKTLLGLYGPNGSGKSSLLKALSGLLSPNERSGFVFFGTEMTDLSKVGSDWARQVLYLGSDFQTPFQITVRELFEMAAAVSKGGVHLELGSAERTRIALVIEALGLTSDLNRILGHMSDGEKQWIMLARGLIQQPRLLLLDETLSKLDMDRLTAVAEILRSSLVDSMT
jgi:iron complex transport system ATP-binding protein